MPLARIADTLIFFVHVPKTGGTSVEAYLRAKGGLALSGARGHGWSRTTPQHMHRAVHAEMVPPGFYDHGFAVLRDPRARLFSEFRMRVEPMRAKLRPLGWMRAAARRARGIPSYGARVGRRLEIIDFDTWVARSFAEYRKDPFYKDNHFRPQHEFIDPGLRLFLFEEGLDPVFRWIDEVTGTLGAAGEFHERRSDDIPITCSAETDALIRDLYREDYDLIDAVKAGRA